MPWTSVWVPWRRAAPSALLGVFGLLRVFGPFRPFGCFRPTPSLLELDEQTIKALAKNADETKARFFGILEAAEKSGAVAGMARNMPQRLQMVIDRDGRAARY